MHRRKFVKVVAAGTSLIVRPSWALALVPAVKITRFRVGLERDMVQTLLRRIDAVSRAG